MSQQINLYNPIFLKQKKIFSALTMAQGLVAIVIGAVALSAFAHFQVRQMAVEVQRNDSRVKTEEERLARLSAQFAARTKSTQLEADIKQAEAALKLREEVLGLLSDGGVGEGGGISAYLRALARQNLNGLWLTGFELSGKDMTISGRALSGDLLPEYLNRLGREEVMRGRQFAMLDMREKKPEAEQGKMASEMPRYIEFSLRSAPPKAQVEGK